MHPKHEVGLTIEKNALINEDEGIIRFPGGQTIIDGQKLRNGLQYDIESMVLEEYAGQVTADHWDSLDMIVGKVINCRKEGDAVKIDGIQFALNSPSGRLAHDLMAAGFLTDMSVETYGPWPDESDDTYYRSKLIGLSVVVVGNSKSARVKKLVLNSLAKAKEDGLDTTAVEAALHVEDPDPEPKPAAAPVKQAAPEPTKQVEQPMKLKTIKNNRSFPLSVSYKNADGDDAKQELASGGTIDVPEEQAAAVEKQINDAVEPKADNSAEITSAVNTAVATALEGVTKPLTDEIEKLKNAFDDKAKEPEFFKTGNSRGGGTTGSKLADLSERERTTLHLESVAQSVLGRSLSAMQTLEAINQFNLDKLKEAGKVENSMTLTDFGNFVLGPENLPGITRNRPLYGPLLEKFKFQETLSLRTAWLQQNGEIEMSDVDMEDHDDNANLKPISEYGTTSHTADLKEFAAVTPVDASVIRFSAADIVANLNQNYEDAYDKALAKSVIGRLEKAIEATGQAVTFDYHTAPVEALISLLTAIEKVAEFTPNGVVLMTEQSRLQLLAFQLRAGGNTDSAWNQVFTNADQPRFFGKPYVIVPSNLLPKVNSAETKSWTFEGVSVTVNDAIIFADPAQFMGRVSGGLSYNVSADASYEVGGVVKSAYQRDQLVFRGYGYRKSAILDPTTVAGVLSPGIS